MLISYVTLGTLSHLHVPWYPFWKMKKDDACLAVYLMGVLAVKMSSCSVYEKGCWLNVKLAFAALNIITLLFCTSSQTLEGFLCACWRSQDYAFPH